MNKRKSGKINMSIIIVSILLLVVGLIMIAIVNMIEGKKEKTQYEGNLITDIEIDSSKYTDFIANENEAELEKLKSMAERTRIEYYVTKFINYIEREEYNKAYELLNNTYKKNYFEKLDNFEEYVKNNFSKMMNIEYTNFERSGDVYVIWLTVTDAINGGSDSGKEINFVVKENDYNDFELSFSAN